MERKKLGMLTDNSVLENMHCHQLFNLIEKGENTNILKGFEQVTFNYYASGLKNEVQKNFNKNHFGY
jgi:hypothetical protein